VLASGTTPVTIVCAPASGTTFPAGSTAVTCTATDSLSQVGSCSFSVSVTPLTLNAMTFVAFGDSVTEGENSLTVGNTSFLFIDPVNAYPTQLQSMLEADFPGQGAMVINEGVSGERATDGVDRIQDVVKQHDPDGVLLLDGYNDLLGDGTLGVQDVADALREMIRIIKAEGVEHVFVSTLTPGRDGSREIDPSAILQANALIRLMALPEGAILVDNFNTFVGRESTLVSDDGLHLTAAGNTVLAETFLAAIRAAVTSGNRPYFLY
jgi:lysophospholipase L1-like esterase